MGRSLGGGRWSISPVLQLMIHNHPHVLTQGPCSKRTSSPEGSAPEPTGDSRPSSAPGTGSVLKPPPPGRLQPHQLTPFPINLSNPTRVLGPSRAARCAEPAGHLPPEATVMVPAHPRSSACGPWLDPAKRPASWASSRNGNDTLKWSEPPQSGVSDRTAFCAAEKRRVPVSCGSCGPPRVKRADSLSTRARRRRAPPGPALGFAPSVWQRTRDLRRVPAAAKAPERAALRYR